MRNQFTSESVTKGHPDKICDQISDAILDAYLIQDSFARTAIECLATTNQLIIAGETNSTANVDPIEVARSAIRQIGYTDPELGFDSECEVLNLIHNQSPDIFQGTNDEIGGAGDQGMMHGYATNETPNFMPAPLYYAHLITKTLENLREGNVLDYLRPDGKSQVTMNYENGKPADIAAIVISTQHAPNVSQTNIKADLKEYILDTLNLPLAKDFEFLINPTGAFVIGGPNGDTGLTGRKLQVDTYGGFAPHGGGAFSGKDPTKVDRSGAYMARYIAKNILANGFADICEVQLAYAIGVPEPVSIMIKTDNDNDLTQWVRDNFDLTPQGIIKTLDLRKPIYQKTASGGHFGRDEFAWEGVMRRG